MSSILLTGAGNVAPIASLGAGYYVRKEEANNTPVEAVAANWPTSTTKMDDVGLNDHTTYETSIIGSTGITKVLKVYASSVSAQSYTASIYCETSAVNVYRSTNGSSWTLWSTPPTPTNMGHGWADINDDPADQTVRYLQFIFEDTVAIDPNADARVGDWRITTA